MRRADQTPLKGKCIIAYFGIFYRRKSDERSRSTGWIGERGASPAEAPNAPTPTAFGGAGRENLAQSRTPNRFLIRHGPKTRPEHPHRPRRAGGRAGEPGEAISTSGSTCRRPTGQIPRAIFLSRAPLSFLPIHIRRRPPPTPQETPLPTSHAARKGTAIAITRPPTSPASTSPLPSATSCGELQQQFEPTL